MVKVFRKIGKSLFWRCQAFVVFETIWNNFQLHIYTKEVHQFKYAWNKTYSVIVMLKRPLLHRVVECLFMFFWYQSATLCYSYSSCDSDTSLLLVVYMTVFITLCWQTNKLWSYAVWRDLFCRQPLTKTSSFRLHHPLLPTALLLLLASGNMNVSAQNVWRRVQEERNVLRTIKKRKVQLRWSHLRRNCLLKHVVERMRNLRIEVTGRRKQLQDDGP